MERKTDQKHNFLLADDYWRARLQRRPFISNVLWKRLFYWRNVTTQTRNFNQRHFYAAQLMTLYIVESLQLTILEASIKTLLNLQKCKAPLTRCDFCVWYNMTCYNTTKYWRELQCVRTWIIQHNFSNHLLWNCNMDFWTCSKSIKKFEAKPQTIASYHGSICDIMRTWKHSSVAKSHFAKWVKWGCPA